ncbi:MAG: hypothetical protein IKE23_00115 [Exiguobacterium sp.]|nr:hypothetical protein [Exiguobacterium sp.]
MINTPERVWAQYQKGVDYLYNLDNFFERVRINEHFWDGKQWIGLDAKNMPKPVFNVLQRAGKFMVSTIGSNDIAVNIVPFTSLADDIERMVPISKEIEHIIEVARMKEASKHVIRNAFVDGSGYMMQTFDPDVETGQLAQGAIKNQLVDCTNVFFGNPFSNDLQGQPYIIVSLRQDVTQVRQEAMELGMSKENAMAIQPDNEGLHVNEDIATNLVTVLLKFYKKKTEVEEETVDPTTGQKIKEKKVKTTVWFTKVTKDAVIKEETDLGYKRYPLACFGWDMIKNSYMYNSPMTSVIQNQIFINKCFAIAQMYGLQSAFPKIIFDKNKVQIEKFMNDFSPQAVAGIDLAGKFIDFIKIPDFSNNIIELAKETIAQTKDMMGVTDASLGNVKPDNTSAILALQESSSVPLEIQKQNFYVFWEDVVRNIIDIVSTDYGVREVMTSDNQLAIIDFSSLKNLNYNLDVEIGNGAQYSEIAQLQTLDKLVQAGYIGPDVYIDVVPSKYIPQKSKLLRSYQERMQQMMGEQPQSRGSNPADEHVPL